MGDEMSTLAVNHPQNRVHAAKITTSDVNHLPCAGGCCLKIATGGIVTGPMSRAAEVIMAHRWNLKSWPCACYALYKPFVIQCQIWYISQE